MVKRLPGPWTKESNKTGQFSLQANENSMKPMIGEIYEVPVVQNRLQGKAYNQQLELKTSKFRALSEVGKSKFSKGKLGITLNQMW